jgi:hypothetical protein
MRAHNSNGTPVPAPYRDTAFRAFLDEKQDRKMPLSDYEKEILGRIPEVEPEKILPKGRPPSFCDRVVIALGGGAT